MEKQKYHNKKWLANQYYKFGKSTREIANICGVNQFVICRAMEKLGLKRRTRIAAITSSRARMKSSISHAKDKSWRWKGGRGLTDNGYILILSKDHPLANDKGYVREHRLIVERILGRYLLPKERIHHINGIKTDNRPENLTIFKNQRDHQAFHCKLPNGKFWERRTP